MTSLYGKPRSGGGSAPMTEFQKFAVAQLIKPPKGIGKAVHHDPRNILDVDLNILIRQFHESFLENGGSCYCHNDSTLIQVMGPGSIFSLENEWNSLHSATDYDGHCHSTYDCDSFATDRSIDRSCEASGSFPQQQLSNERRVCTHNVDDFSESKEISPNDHHRICW